MIDITPPEPPTALVLGAGIAGLASALALSRTGYSVTILERDAPPPATSPDEAFEYWDRKGVTHVRHSHAFLAVLYQMLRDRYPDLLQQLIGAGCRELKFADAIPETLHQDYVAEDADLDLTILTSRRTTLEFIIRDYVATQPNVHIETGTRVRGLVVDNQATPPTVTGVMSETDSQPLAARGADIVVDASGRTSQIPTWLQAHGIHTDEETAPCGILYFTRHYRLNPGCAEPERGSVPAAGDLGYLKYGVFPADNGCFSITLAVPEIETGLRMALVNPETFDAACSMLPGLVDWISPERATPASKVLGMGNLESRWRNFLNHNADGTKSAKVAGLFAVGDAAIRTNPLYGRGCSCAFVEAHALAQTLQQASDPAEQPVIYAQRLETDIRPYYNNMQKQDLSSIRRAEHGLEPNYKPGFKSRLVSSFADDAITPALRSSLPLMREAMKGFHMLEAPNDWLLRPANMLRILAMWLRPRVTKAHLYPPKLGPDRVTMHAHLNATPATA